MRKIILITTTLFLLITFNSCHKEKPELDVPDTWKYCKLAPAGCTLPAAGDSIYFVCFSQEKCGSKSSFPKIHRVWTINGVPVTNTRGQMLFGASATIPIGVNPWDQIVTYFANNPQRDHVVVSHFIDGGPNNESWTITTF